MVFIDCYFEIKFCKQVSGFATMLESRRIPILYIYCDADPMVDSKLSGEFAEIFGITSELTDSYDTAGQLVEKGESLAAILCKRDRN